MLSLASCNCSGLKLQTRFCRHFLQDMIQLYFLLVIFIYLKVKAPLLACFFYLFAYNMFPTGRYDTHHEHLSCRWCCVAHYHSLRPWTSLCQHVVSLWSTRCIYWLLSSIFQTHGSHTHCLCAQLTRMSSWIVWNLNWSISFFNTLPHSYIKLLYGGIWQAWEGVEYTNDGESKTVVTDSRKWRKCSNCVCF